jgi:hypothetical protein
MDNLSFEQKIVLLALAKNPKEKAELVSKFSNNKEFFMGVNRRTMPLAQYMELNKDKFAPVAAKAKVLRDNMKNKGWTAKKYQKYLAEIPQEIFTDRPEFSAYLPQEQLKKNIEAFLSMYPQFRVDK